MPNYKIGDFGKDIAIYDDKLNAVFEKFKKQDEKNVESYLNLVKFKKTAPLNFSKNLDKQIDFLTEYFIKKISLLEKEHIAMIILLEYLNNLEEIKDKNDSNKIFKKIKLLEKKIDYYSNLLK
tara:strand:+ start:2292 stop:2660 length:369 start_codon:yes stop_codon:yes gene_type:complete